ncbi:MAG TPA: hypothetical protein VF837_03460 [Patescibacteria group bacterium]
MAAEERIIGYKKVFGFVLPDWVDERQINLAIGYVLVALVMVFVLLLFVNPNKSVITKNNQLYKTESAALTTLKASKVGLDNLSTQINSDEQDAIFRAMPTNYSPEEAIFTLRNIAGATGVTIIDYTLPGGVILDQSKKEFTGSTGTSTQASVVFQSFLVNITVSGDINAISNFADRVEKSLPIGFVSDLGIQEAAKISTIGGKSQVNLKLQITYYQPNVFSFNLNNLQQFSPDDLALVKELSGYARLNTSPSTSFGGQGATPSAGGVGTNLFGL